MNQGCKYDKTHFLRNKSEEGKKIHGRLSASVVRSLVSTVFVLRIAHRKWKEIKQQPSLLPGPAVPGCRSVSFHILLAILSTSTVLLQGVNLFPDLNCMTRPTTDRVSEEAESMQLQPGN